MAVSTKTRCIVWARAAGRCQFLGCNKLLIGDLVAGNDGLNAAYVAHIVAETEGGPRGDLIRSPLLADDPANLMLMCDPHHRLIDRDEIKNYPEERLLSIKKTCEQRIELATGIAPDRASAILRYGAVIGANESVISIPQCSVAMAETHFPASREPIDLSMAGVELSDSEPDYFPVQIRNLRRQFDAKVRGRLERHEIEHVSVFALAPIPLLIELGCLLSDISPAAVYQLHREPAGWRWARDGGRVNFRVHCPEAVGTTVALKIGLSACVTDDRVYDVLGQNTTIWSVDVGDPHNDCIRYPEDLAEYRRLLRRQFSLIKATHGESCEICLFPAVPVSIAIETGRVWMPKADLRIRIFDQAGETGFVERHRLG